MRRLACGGDSRGENSVDLDWRRGEFPAGVTVDYRYPRGIRSGFCVGSIRGHVYVVDCIDDFVGLSRHIYRRSRGAGGRLKNGHMSHWIALVILRRGVHVNEIAALGGESGN